MKPLRVQRFVMVAASLLCLAQWISGHAFGQPGIFVIVPPEAAGANEGDSAFRPFATSQSGRFQQVFSASAFTSSLPPEGGLIRSIFFRVDTISGHPFLVTIGSFQLNLSTTSLAPDGLSSIFADNIGANDTVVIEPRSMQISGAPGTGFSVRFNFPDHPFYYNPADGNLLMDFRIFTGAGAPPFGGAPFDAFEVVGDSVSSVFAYGPTLPTMGQSSTLGLAAAFGIVPVPEPSTYALLALSLGALIIHWRQRRRRKEVRNAVT